MCLCYPCWGSQYIVPAWPVLCLCGAALLSARGLGLPSMARVITVSFNSVLLFELFVTLYRFTNIKGVEKKPSPFHMLIILVNFDILQRIF